MRRILFAFAVCALAATAQTKKVVALGMSAEDLADLQTATNRVQLIPATKDDVLKKIADADGFIGAITPEMVRAGKKLRWVAIRSAGVETILHKSGGTDLRDSNIVVTNNQIVQGPEIADHALAMLLALTRRLDLYMKDRESENWRREKFTGIELRGKTGVVIGLGGIGQQIAIRAWAFGMNIIGVDPEDIPFSPFWSQVVKPDQLNEVLPKADVVFISAPHTERTHKMIGAAQFDLMKQNSYFIAVSRGAIYDLNALVKALDSKKLAGAGVDVTDPEPLPQGNALWKFSNAIITPHIAGRSDQDAQRMTNTIKENLKRFGDDRPLLNVVDKQKGY